MLFSNILLRSVVCVSSTFALASATAYPDTGYSKNSRCPENPKLDAAYVDPVSFSALPTIFSDPATPGDSTDFNQIRQATSLYALAVDGKNADPLIKVFTPDVVANLSRGGLIKGLPALQVALLEGFVGLTTQHQIGTQFIDIAKGGCQAKSITYFTATLLGTGPSFGQVCSF